MRTFFSRLGKLIWRFMIIFSFIVNIILVLVLLALGLFIFDIKNNIANPLVSGLHSSFVGLDSATIDWTIPVREKLAIGPEQNVLVPINMNTIVSQVTRINGAPVSPLPGETVVRLTRDVPLTLRNVNITTGGLTVSGATGTAFLPAGTELPVALDLILQLNAEIPVNLDVRAVIPLDQTQLHDVAHNLRLLFEPLARALHNLPDNWGGVPQWIANWPPNLLADNAYSVNPWPGFSRTAGLNYTLLGVEAPPRNRPVETGIVQTGGIPALDEQLRPEIYVGGGPLEVNAQAQDAMQDRGIAQVYFDGGISGVIEALQVRGQSEAPDESLGTNSGPPPDELNAQAGDQTQSGDANSGQTPEEDLGIVPTTPSTP